MAQRQRIDRGSGADRVQIAFRVDPLTKVKVNRMADAMGLSQSQVIEWVLSELVEVDEESMTVLVGGRPLAPQDEELQYTA